MVLKAVDSMGQDVNPGDTMLDFRGERAILVKATRAKTDNKMGKVVVRWVGDRNPDRQLEYYDKIFDLTVIEVKE